MAYRRGSSGKRAIRAHRHNSSSKGSGYKRSGSGFFPSHAPVWWSYTSAFLENANHGFVVVGERASSKLTGARVSSLRDSWSNPKVIVNITNLMNSARASELAFLAKYGLGNPGDNWSELIQAFNYMFQTRDAFERNIQVLKQVQDKTDSTKIYHDFVSFFSGYLQKAARDVIREKGVDLVHANLQSLLPKMTTQIIQRAVRNLFKETDYVNDNGKIVFNAKKDEKKNMQQIQAYRNILEILSYFKNNDFLKGITKELDLTNFITDTANQMYENKQNHTSKALPLIKSTITNGNAKGSVQELFQSVFLQAAADQLQGETDSDLLKVKWDVHRTGTSGVKADVIGYHIAAQGGVDYSLLESQAGADDSNRVNAINKYEEFFRRYSEARGEIIFVSDKNYQIKSDFGGFMAQSNVTLSNLEALLNKVGAESTGELVDFLANCGEGMLLGNKDTEVLDAVAVQIGHFLFDDLTITGAVGINRVHLLNLSGIYMPLSVYLDAILKSITEAMMDVQSLVHVTFHGGGGPAASPWSGKGDFDTFREQREDNSYVNVKFMKNFASFITAHAGI